MIRWMRDPDAPESDVVLDLGDVERVMDAKWLDWSPPSEASEGHGRGSFAFMRAAEAGDVWVYIDPFTEDVARERVIGWAPSREAAAEQYNDAVQDL